MRNNNIKYLVLSALLSAIGIIIPMYSPIKILIPPASFTLGSHIVLFIAMFINVRVAVYVSIATTIGFFLGGFPPIIVARAFTHVVFVSIGAIIIKNNKFDVKKYNYATFCGLISVIHAIMEVVAVACFYLIMGLPKDKSLSVILSNTLLLVGIGTFIHSTVDFYLALIIMKYVKIK